jgi:hypothetical protein
LARAIFANVPAVISAAAPADAIRNSLLLKPPVDMLVVDFSFISPPHLWVSDFKI